MSRPTTLTTDYTKLVAFFVYLTRDYSVFNAYRPIVFDNIVTNVGGAYHKSSGTFYAPKTGLYVFTWTIRVNEGSYYTTELVVQNQVVHSVYFSPQHHVDGSVSGTVVVFMNALDDACIRTGPRYHHGLIKSDVDGRSSFGGWIIM